MGGGGCGRQRLGTRRARLQSALPVAMLGGGSGDGERDTDEDAVGAVAAPPAIDFPAEVSDPKYDGKIGMARAVPRLVVHLGSRAPVVPKSHLRPQAASGIELGSIAVGRREAAGGPSRVRQIFISRESMICPFVGVFISWPLFCATSLRPLFTFRSCLVILQSLSVIFVHC